MRSTPSNDTVGYTDPAFASEFRYLEGLDSFAELAFERLARLAAALLDAPLALIALARADQLAPISAVGLPADWSSWQESPVPMALCEQILCAGEPCMSEDLRREGRIGAAGVALERGVVSYAGIPLLSPDGRPVGALAVADRMPRSWSREQLAQLCDLAALAMAELELHYENLEHKRAAHEREQLVAELQDAVRVREHFLSIAAHELRTPLTSLLGCAQLLQRQLDARPLGKRDRQLLEGIAGDVLRLDRMIESLLDVSRAQTGRLKLARKPLDLASLAARAVSELLPETARRRTAVHCSDTPLVVLGDEQRLLQVLDHLLQNALRYSPGPGPIEVCVEERNGMASISVSDQGIGVPQAALPRIFSAFYRAPNVHSLQAGGLGVGLYLVKELVALHGGDVEVTSEEYEGSTFRVYLPLYKGPDE